MKGIKRLTDQISPTLLELWLGMLLYGLLIQIILLVATKQRLYYSIGLWTGIVMAIFLGGMILYSINRAVDRDEEHAKSYTFGQYCMRMAVSIVVFAILAWFHIGSLVTAFIGVLSLKLSAYAQPGIHKLLEGR